MIRAKVTQFHLAMNVPVLEKPTIPEETRVRLRMSLIAEEFFEVIEAVYPVLNRSDVWEWGKKAVYSIIKHSHITVDLPRLADSLCDIDYVVEGTRLEFGIFGQPILEESPRCEHAQGWRSGAC